MSDRNARIIRSHQQKLTLSCFLTVIGERHIQGRWFALDAIVDYMNAKYQLQDEDNMIKRAQVKCMLNKYYGVTTSIGNSVSLDESRGTVTLYRHVYRLGSRESDFLFVKSSAINDLPKYPTPQTSQLWYSQCASSLIAPVTRQRQTTKHAPQVSEAPKEPVLQPPAKRQRTRGQQSILKGTGVVAGGLLGGGEW